MNEERQSRRLMAWTWHTAEVFTILSVVLAYFWMHLLSDPPKTELPKLLAWVLAIIFSVSDVGLAGILVACWFNINNLKARLPSVRGRKCGEVKSPHGRDGTI